MSTKVKSEAKTIRFDEEVLGRVAEHAMLIGISEADYIRAAVASRLDVEENDADFVRAAEQARDFRNKYKDRMGASL